MNAWNVAVFVQVEINEVLALIWNIILLHSLIHVEGSTQTLPGVRGSVLIELKVSVQDLVHGLLTAYLDGVVCLGELVEDPDLPGLLAQSANAEALILPPWSLEASWIPVRIWHKWWDVKVSSHGAIIPKDVSFWINCFLWLKVLIIEPVRDVSAGSLNHGLSRFKMNVLLNELGEIIDFTVKAKPTVISCAMFGHLLRSVVIAKLVRSWQMSGILLA